MTRKLGKIIVADLIKRSEKGLNMAKQILRAEEMNHPKLREALEHYFANWNEFVHPGLLSVACEAVEGDPDDVIAVQAAIAMMTAAFDVHDDIIDKSKEKNKTATVYGKFGEGIALLLGNAFLIEGLKFFADSVTALPKERERSTLEMLRKLLFEVGNAHALEIGLKERKNIAPSEYIKITEMKAASIEADMHFGALFGGGNDAEIAVLSRIGRILGILATLRDDLVDVFDIEELRQRISVQDLPLPLLFAMQDQEAKDKLVDILTKPKISKSGVATIVDITLTAPPVVHLKNQMRLLIEEGSNLTNRLPKKESRRKLQAILSFMLEDL